MAGLGAELAGPLILLALAGAVLLVGLSAILAVRMTRPTRRTSAYALAHGMPCDPGDLGLEFESWDLDRPDGATIAVWEMKTDDHAPPRTIVLVHGWGQSRVDMLQRLEAWRGLARRAVLYDLRGHGTSTGVSRIGANEDDDLRALLERLGDEDDVVLVGHSMGAGIAIGAAAENPRVAAVVIEGAYDTLPESLRRRVRAMGLPARPMTDLVAWALRLVGRRFEAASANAARVDAPLLVLHGSDDTICPLADAERIADAAPHGTLVVLEGAGHLDGHRVTAGAYREAVEGFLG